MGKGMFPYYTCTLTCHNGSAGGQPKLEKEVIDWNESRHAQATQHGSRLNSSCIPCHSPPLYNQSSGATIATSDWLGIQCRVCHNLHNDTYSGNSIPFAFYNATATSQTGSVVYDAVANATVLCEKCHTGSHREISYGGSHRTTLNLTCISCHGNSTFNNQNHIFEVKNTTSGVTGCEVCHDQTDHTWQFTSLHIDKATCEACHDQKFVVNATNFSVFTNGISSNDFGLYKNSTTNKWTTYKISSGAPKPWSLHNMSKNVNCDKCHNATSPWNGTTRQDISIAPPLACADCHPAYSSAVNLTRHNQSLNPAAPNCTLCHAGYLPVYGHTSGNRSFVVNESNTCRNSGCHEQNVSGFYERHNSVSDCTQCHFANTTQTFSLNASLYTHDHNLTVEHNFYEYNVSGMPVRTNGGVGVGMFPYYTCTLTCHKYNATTGVEGKVDVAAKDWHESRHAQATQHGSRLNSSCIPCHSPPLYNQSSGATITTSDWLGVQCRVCHNLHDRKHPNNTGPSGFPVAFYNATNSSLLGYVAYDAVTNYTVLCEKCHTGSHREISYGGNHRTTYNLTCISCHGNSTFNNQSHIFEVKNTTSGVTGCEVCHSTANHTWPYTSLHVDKATCEACHDQKFVVNATNFSVFTNGISSNDFGLYKNSTTNKWTTYKVSSGAPKPWSLHNMSKNVSCNKCHTATSPWNGTTRQDTLIAPELTCNNCHASYSSAVNLTRHNQSLNPAAPNCTLCHVGYLPVYRHTSGNRSYVVNESNTCRNSGCHEQNVSGFYERHTSSSDCTTCHFANTTQTFSLNASLYTHDHNLTVEHNFYEYNLSGMPVRTNGGVGVGVFPYYTCTLTCHKYNATTGEEGKVDEAAKSWLESAHAQSLHMSGDNRNSCAKCKSPANYNASASSSTTIAQADWQGIQCRVCHNLHDRRHPNNTGPSGFPIAFYNSTLSSQAGYAVYEQVPNATALCLNCHTGSSHDSKFAGTHKDTAGFNCTDCHMNSSFSNELHTFEVKNTTSGVTGCEVCHTYPGTTHSLISNYHVDVTCWACHDRTVSRNSSDYVVSSDNTTYGLYKDSTTGKWTTYKLSHGEPASWPLHNISRNVTCEKCHGAKSAYSGTIATGFGSNATFTTDRLVSGYNLIALSLIPEPAITARDLLYTSGNGIRGVTKLMRWNASGQTWEGYEYTGAVYLGTNFSVDGYRAYFILGNASTAGLTYQFKGRAVMS